MTINDNFVINILNIILMMSRTLENVDMGKCLLSHILFVISIAPIKAFIG